MISSIKNLLYIYQLSEYDNGFFLRWINNHPDLDSYLKSKKENPVWTIKAKIIFIISFFYLPLYLFFPKKRFVYSLILAAAIIKPLEIIVIFFIVQKIKFRLKKYKNLIKIGITGSYGKTTTKEYLAEILSVKYRVLKSPENINTLLGLAKFISKNLDESFQVLVIEMAAYKKGDIKKFCRMINPEIRILTGLADSHLERFGSLENIVEAKFEIAESLLDDKNLVFLNADNPFIVQNYQKFFKINPEFYGINPEIQKVFKAENIKISEEGLEFNIFKNQEFYFNAKIRVFGRQNIEPILLVISIADKLGLSKEEILTGLKNLKPLPRRLFPTKNSQGIVIIDDSYNISKASIEAALEFLKETFPKRRKIIIAAGLVEQGVSKNENNKWFGEKIKTIGDLNLIIRNSNTQFIIKGTNLPEKEILEYNKNRRFETINQKIVIFENAEELNFFLPEISKSGDAILMFPYDLPAHYY
ncbi:MAG: UDP-N-acetylmuramoyl-tripeptide--D-alanyl-D-alanine ligase [Patescibacteria group bacterium]